MIITIDGPTASGKSTVAQQLADSLSFYYINSGLLFRACAFILDKECSYNSSAAHQYSEEVVRTCLDINDLQYVYDQYGAHIYHNHVDITSHLKTAHIDQVASFLSTYQSIRLWATEMQRAIALKNDVVIEGRDAGTIVFPRAEHKFFLTARVEIRAQRWIADQLEKGNYFSRKQAIQEITERDERDSTRSIAPLQIPESAYIIDNSDITIFQTVNILYNYIKNSSGV